MVKTVKTKKRLKRSLVSKVLSVIACAAMLGGIIFFIISGQKQIKTTLDLTADLSVAQQQLKQLEEEKAYLEKEKEKLTDPNYVSSVARGKYLITKDNEQIFTLPPLDD